MRGYRLALIGSAWLLALAVFGLVGLWLIAGSLLQALPVGSQSRVAEAGLAYQAGDFDKTVTMAQTILAEDPRNGSALNILALGLAGQRRLDEAAVAAEQAVKLLPIAEVYDTQAYVAVLRSDYLTATIAYDTIDQSKLTNDSRTYFLLGSGIALRAVGRENEGRARLMDGLDAVAERQADANWKPDRELSDLIELAELQP